MTLSDIDKLVVTKINLRSKLDTTEYDDMELCRRAIGLQREVDCEEASLVLSPHQGGRFKSSGGSLTTCCVPALPDCDRHLQLYLQSNTLRSNNIRYKFTSSTDHRDSIQ